MTVDYAKETAELLHQGQFRADGVTPYIEHPRVVAELVTKFGGSEKAVCLAWLHDIMEENAEGTREFIGLENIMSKAKWYMELKRKKLEAWMDIAFDLAKLSDHWDSDQQDIETRGKMAYLTSLLLDANQDVLLVKLCDMLANIRESGGKRMNQEKRYLVAVRGLMNAERMDLTKEHRALCEEIRTLVHEHLMGNSIGSINNGTDK